ncbi:MAG: site-2 protease family protein [Candidatus Thermoplasmatota archaeon]
MKTSINIGKVYGIPVKLHFTLIFIVALIAWSVGSNVFLLAEMLGIPDPDIALGWESYMLGVVIAVGLLISVFLHEMAHSIVSIKSGYRVDEISLWLFGGVSKMEETPSDPNLEIKISAVGPLSSIAIGFITFVGGTLMVNDLLVFTLLYLSFINFFLAGFNLIPAFPMDGGRILRALLAKRYSYIKATKTAATVGKVFAVIFGIVGLFVNIFLVLIAFFIYMAASQESQNVLMEHMLSKVSIGSIMSREVKTVEPETTIEEFLEMVTTHQHTGYPVVSGERIIGIITLNDATKVSQDMIHTKRVKEVMETDIVCLSPDDDASKAWKTMTQEQFGRFPILENDDLVGVVTRSDIMQAFQIQTEMSKYGENL